MAPLARKFAALVLSAALTLAAWPSAAFADPAPAPTPAAALAQMKQWGVYKDDNDVLKSYLGDANHLTPIGQAIYDSLSARTTYNPADAATALQPALDGLRQQGPYNPSRQTNSDKVVSQVRTQLQQIQGLSGGGSTEDSFRQGALTQAAISGAAVVDPVNQAQLIQETTPNGFRLYDNKGLAYILNKQNATIYSRDLQRQQHQMNLHPQPQVPFVPETGRYNKEYYDYTYWTLKNQYDQLFDAARRDRMIALADLLGKTSQYRSDMWFTDKTLEADLIAEAKAKRYNNNGREYSVYDIVEADFTAREKFLKDALAAVQHYQSDSRTLLAGLSANPIISDGAVKSLALDQQAASLALTRAFLETQIYQAKTMESHLDQSSPDSKQVIDALHQLGLSLTDEAKYKARMRQMMNDVETVRRQLEGTRDLLERTDPASSLNAATAILTASQTALSRISTDYSMIVEIPSVAALAKTQTDVWAIDLPNRAIRGIVGVFKSGYSADMSQIGVDQGTYRGIVQMVINNNIAGARQAVIAMNPHAADRTFQQSLFGDQTSITDDVRIAASLKTNRDRIVRVYETNKWIDTTASIIDWSAAIALGGGLAGSGLRLAARGFSMAEGWAARAAAAEGANLATRAFFTTVERVSIAGSEISLHMAARLQTLETMRSKDWAASFESSTAQYLARSAVRGLNAASRQVTLSLTMGVISGTVNAGTQGYHMMTGGHSPYTSDLSGVGSAFWDGAKGGIWWANESWHPLLNYVALPSSVFRGTFVARAMEIVGTRGVVDTGWSILGAGVSGGSWLAAKVLPTALKAGGGEAEIAGAGWFGATRNALWPAAATEGAAAPGLLDRLAELGPAGRAAAVPLSLVDNIAKYQLVSTAASGVGHMIAYASPQDASPRSATLTPQEDLALRIKTANNASTAWEQAPIWLLIPQFSAHTALEGEAYRNNAEGMRQYDAANDFSYGNARAGDALPFKDAPKTPLANLIFDMHFFRDPPGKWTVTDEIKLKGIQKGLVEAIGGTGAKVGEINPKIFLDISRKESGEIGQLKINDLVQSVAYKNFIEALLKNPEGARRILEAKPGTTVDGVLITPEYRRDAAVALYSAQMQVGRAMSQDLAPLVRDVLKANLDSNLKTRGPATSLIEALSSLKARPEFLGEGGVVDKILEATAEWRRTQEQTHVGYMDFVETLRTQAAELRKAGTITADEAAVLGKLYDYIGALEARLNSFNSVEHVSLYADESFESLLTQFRGPKQNDPAVNLLTNFRRQLAQWGDKPDRSVRVVGNNAPDTSFGELVVRLRTQLRDATGLTQGQRDAIAKSIDEMEASPWAVRDKSGAALWSWRPEQFEALMGALTAFVSRRPGGFVRVFQMLKTGGGKTFLAFEGLLPLVEADAKARGKKVVFMTVQSNLEAQARLDFIAYRKIGSNMSFETYESLKTKSATGKMQGRNAMRDYWILGDEMDGAALQPALTIGQVSGRVSRLSPFWSRFETMDEALDTRIASPQAAQDAGARNEGRRAQIALRDIDAPNAAAIKDEFARLDDATSRLVDASGPLDRYLAQADARDSLARLDAELSRVPSTNPEAMVTARDALGRVKSILDAPEVGDRARGETADELGRTFRREGNVLQSAGSEAGLLRLTADADAASGKLARRIDSLTTQAEAAEGSKLPGAAERARALRDEIGVLEREKAMTDRFVTVDTGRRLASLQDRIAAADAKPEGDPRAAAWRREAADIEGSLTPEGRALAKDRAQNLADSYSVGRRMNRLDEFGRQMTELDAAAQREGWSAQTLAQRRGALLDSYPEFRDSVENGGWSAQKFQELRSSLEDTHSSLRAETSRQKAQLRDLAAGDDLAGLMSRIEILRQRNDPAAQAERASLVDRAEALVRKGLQEAAAEIRSIVEQGGRGWRDRAGRLLEQRRALAKSFAGDMGPMYEVFARMKEDAQAFATSVRMRSQKEIDYTGAQKLFEDLIDGEKLTFFETARMMWKALRGQNLEIMIERNGKTRLAIVGKTRQRAAEMLQALWRDPTMPANQADNVFWDLMGSLLWPRGSLDATGGRGRGSWVRNELKAMLDGFFEDPAGIRLDNRTNKINVVHNGQWFESMDNDTRRYWQLAYGTDIDLRYTNQSISTIRDLTTDKETNFISFSGTAGEKLREHFVKNDITIVGQGSTAPPSVRLNLTGRPGDTIGAVGEAYAALNSASGEVVVPEMRDAPLELRQAVVDRANGRLPGSVVLRLDAFSGEGQQAGHAWLEKNGESRGDGLVEIRSVEGAPQEVRLAALDALSGPEKLRVDDFASFARDAARRGDAHAATYEKAVSQLHELRAGTGDADGAVLRLRTEEGVPADVIPDEVRPALDAYLKDPKFNKKSQVVVRISDVKGETDAQTAAARQWLRDLRKVVEIRIDQIPPEARPALDAYLANSRFKGQKTALIRVSEIRSGDPAQAEAARAWLRTQPDAQGSGLLVLSVSDTRVLKMVRQYLIKVKGLAPDQISMVFSDTEYLRNNVPEARVAEQMNLSRPDYTGGLDTGRTRVLILDTRVGGRGLDLNFKGQRRSLDPEAFRGYTDFSMLILDPHKMSQVHLLQAEGRIDVGRVMPNAERNFALVMDIASISNYGVFRDMVRQDPFFEQLRADPQFQAYVRQSAGAMPEWALMHDFMVTRAADGTAEGAALAQQYRQAMQAHVFDGLRADPQYQSFARGRRVEIALDSIPAAARAGLDPLVSGSLADGKKTAVVRLDAIREGRGVTKAQADAARAWLGTLPDAPALPEQAQFREYALRRGADGTPEGARIAQSYFDAINREFFERVRASDDFLSYARARGVSEPDWAVYHDYISMRAADGTAEGRILAEEYDDVVKHYLEVRQGQVEEGQLQGSSVIDAMEKGRPTGTGLFPGVEGLR
jgi:hypothetical protein